MTEPKTYHFTPVSSSTFPSSSNHFLSLESEAPVNSSNGKADSFPKLRVDDLKGDGIDSQDYFRWYSSNNQSVSLSPDLGLKVLNCLANPFFLKSQNTAVVLREDSSSQIAVPDSTIPNIDEMKEIPGFSSQWSQSSNLCFPFWGGEDSLDLRIVKGESLYPGTENSYWPGLNRITSRWSLGFFLKRICLSVGISAIGFIGGSRIFGAFCGAPQMGVAALWTLYSLNFVGLVGNGILNQVEWKGKIENAYLQVDPSCSSAESCQKSNFEISKAKSAMGESDLYWGITLSLVSFVCGVIDRKSFKNEGTFAFARQFPSYLAQASSALFRGRSGLFLAIPAFLGLYEISTLWLETFCGLKEKTVASRGYSAFSTFVLETSLLARASWEIKKTNFLSGSLKVENALSLTNFLKVQRTNSLMFQETMRSRIIGSSVLGWFALLGLGIGISYALGQLIDYNPYSEVCDRFRKERDAIKLQMRGEID